MAKYVGLCNLHGAQEFGKMTRNRAVASVSFLGRYALIDIALSNFVNSGIDVTDILIENHIKSILGHVGTLQTWNENTKIGKDRVMFNESAIGKKEKNTDINNLVENPWLLYSNTTQYVCVTSGSVLLSLNFKPVLKIHEKENRKLTIIYAHIDDADKTFLKGDVVEVKDDKVVSLRKNTGKRKDRDVFTESYVISFDLFKDLVSEAKELKSSESLYQIIKRKVNSKEIIAHAYKYEGYIRNFDSFKHYKEYSLELTDKEPCDALFKHDWPFYTPTHDTPPAKYGENADVRNSYVANGCIIDGKVSGSILGRGVVIEKGAVVKNSIILAGTTIKAKARIEDAVVDKFVVVNSKNEVVGTKEEPAYVVKGAII